MSLLYMTDLLDEEGGRRADFRRLILPIPGKDGGAADRKGVSAPP